MRALSIAASGMQAQQLNVDVISHNIANMNTTGFKRQRAEFQDMLYQNMERPGSTSSASGSVLPLGIQIGVGVRTDAVGRITEQGSITATSNPYDLAINGRGYFQVTMPSGQTGYTRAGNLAVNADGQMVTSDGYPIEPSITVPAEATAIQITRDGIVEVTLAGQTDPQQIGQLEIASFINPAGLEGIGDNLFLETPASGTATTATPGSPGMGTLMQGFLELSNVNAVEEISSLIVAQRAYEMNARVITAADEMLQSTTQLR
ncbi:flagellar basal-body rod protein FlgG [Candidatus Viadribacter manganicus]|uniref:Flagellar basal-body rod protein FlgG n=1 Tax=Candidatus Viadribacter manganicus TaxID=1759059 RepID=A0A1B1ALC0_9PROT|nr:flagellar basal-body rod protein FlgG [Candidatus Viadribacter manganicus]ANP47345.1 flagellar basal-body rod protein FlgG [Candidatus Viadribacter manganicus]